MRQATASRLAWASLGFVAFSVAAGQVLYVQTGSGADPFEVAMLSFPLVGALVASRRPRNPIGWIMLGVGIVSGLGSVLGTYSIYGLDTIRGRCRAPTSPWRWGSLCGSP
jgi:hypothetical protein